ncbi:glyoxalase [Reyranella sp.]|uniref:glyoxalase n=1 Tax=Reyranella sp. TaxID=1929291 RepID=UPI000BDD5E1B|nr:glyoxalase [Reyranella sp.]OYY42044.1 MAG: catechol 1,2-dioxygenase [Rhodospirillales bacterium 35-66-84]OYZ93825.1 MAG: catechol 1,2-dioxygenase [Rhodospirillales bacterium 24-66-33]OZB25075.1 MAG: catechol 1,2-dioxygenase [Rhodospirillales bacterium 39-66-50]HQS17929.1 glyoxalase [Reyranella sp.]HQT10634.1 glyoxalase [Reyranella sp.]
MAVIKAAEFAWPRMEAPDLDEMEEFLTHFGLIRAERTATALYMRGTDDHHHLHVTQKGGTKFIGFAYHAEDEEDLKRLTKLPGASDIETLDEPGGGRRVRLTEPNGYQIEVVAGQKRCEPVRVVRDEQNTAREPGRRVGRVLRLGSSPTSIQRIGHGVLGSPKVTETVAWFRETLGMIRSDDVYAGAKDNIIGSFNRLDRGDAYVDHHVFFCNHNTKAGLHHVSYEVQDIDCVFQDHEYLERLGKYDHVWGIGRHLLGSQVYDYWSDPWGRVHERWADTDRLNAGDGGNLVSAEEGLRSQWGDGPPERFIGHTSP